MGKPKNVVFIMTDQQHFRTLGCHGVAEARTPNLDRLAARGLDFRNHIVTNPVCSPSRASIMTGKQITEHGLWANGCTLPADQETIAQRMVAAGWQTAHFGKLHLVPIITRTEPHPPYGFQTCKVSEGDQQLIDDAHFRWLRKTDPDLFVRYLTEMFLQGHTDGYKSLMPEEKHLTTWVTQRSIEWLKQHRAKQQPFFLSVGYFDPHHAFNPCEPYASMYDDIPVEPPVFNPRSMATRPPHYQSFYKGVRKITRNRKRITVIRRAYHAMCAHIDKCVGDLIRALHDEGLADDTVVIFTSDHGETLGNHGLLWKGPFLLDDLMRVPLLVGIPGQDLGGRQVTELTSGADFFATIQAVAGVEDVRRASGQPFLEAHLNLFPDGPRRAAFAEWEHPKNGPTGSLQMVRTADWKLVHYRNDASEGELYDLKNDPNEFRNRYLAAKYAAVRAELTALLPNRPRPNVRYEGGW
jgi:arylsulfatase A-like enzyme